MSRIFEEGNTFYIRERQHKFRPQRVAAKTRAGAHASNCPQKCARLVPATQATRRYWSGASGMGAQPTPFSSWPSAQRAPAGTAATAAYMTPKPKKRAGPGDQDMESAMLTEAHSAREGLHFNLDPQPITTTHVRHIAGLLRSIATVIAARSSSHSAQPSRAAHPHRSLRVSLNTARSWRRS